MAEAKEEQAALGLRLSDSFQRDYRRLPRPIQAKADEQIQRLAHREFHHPSLGFKKLKGTGDIWEARVTRNYRITFQMQVDAIVLRRIGTHDILGTP